MKRYDFKFEKEYDEIRAFTTDGDYQAWGETAKEAFWNLKKEIEECEGGSVWLDKVK